VSGADCPNWTGKGGATELSFNLTSGPRKTREGKSNPERHNTTHEPRYEACVGWGHRGGRWGAGGGTRTIGLGVMLVHASGGEKEKGSSNKRKKRGKTSPGQGPLGNVRAQRFSPSDGKGGGRNDGKISVVRGN